MRFMIELDRDTTIALGMEAQKQLRDYKQQAIYMLRERLGIDGVNESKKTDPLNSCQTDSDHSSFTPEKQRPTK